MEKQNRAERRKSKFGRGRAAAPGGWPTHQPNPVFGGETGEATPGGTLAPVTSTDQPMEPADKPAEEAGNDDEASDTAKS